MKGLLGAFALACIMIFWSGANAQLTHLVEAEMMDADQYLCPDYDNITNINTTFYNFEASLTFTIPGPGINDSFALVQFEIDGPTPALLDTDQFCGDITEVERTVIISMQNLQRTTEVAEYTYTLRACVEYDAIVCYGSTPASGSCGVDADEFEFTVIIYPYLPPVILTEPLDDSLYDPDAEGFCSFDNPELKWEMIEGVDYYEVELSRNDFYDPNDDDDDDRDMYNIMEVAVVLGTSWTPDLGLAGGADYYWRVKALQGQKCPGPVSEDYRFAIGAFKYHDSAVVKFSMDEGAYNSYYEPDLRGLLLDMTDLPLDELIIQVVTPDRNNLEVDFEMLFATGDKDESIKVGEGFEKTIDDAEEGDVDPNYQDLLDEGYRVIPSTVSVVYDLEGECIDSASSLSSFLKYFF